MSLINAEGKRFHVKNYLTSIYSMHQEMRAKQERLDRLRAVAEGLRTVMGESVSGGVKRDIADIKHEIDELADDYAGDLTRYASEIAEGYRICPPSNLPRYVCWLHWAEGKSWEDVSNETGYSRDHIRKDLCMLGVEGIYDDMPRKFRVKIPSSL